MTTSSYPAIDPVPHQGTARPFWSVMIPTFNCAGYLAHTLRSVLRQDPGPETMQIEVIDDVSTRDDPEAVVRELGRGRVNFYRQPKNGGAIANFNTCLQRSRGHWVHVLHGDDLVLDGFYAKMRQGLDAQPQVGAAVCREIVVNGDGNWISLRELINDAPGLCDALLEKLSAGNCLQFAGVVIRREAVESLGGFHPQLIHAADWEMWMRIAAHYAVWYEPQPLACYREHGNSDTSRLHRTGENVRDFRRAIAVANPYMTAKLGPQWIERANTWAAMCAIACANRMLLAGDFEGMRAQAREVPLCSRSRFIRRMYWHYVTRQRLAPRRVAAAVLRRLQPKPPAPPVPSQPART